MTALVLAAALSTTALANLLGAAQTADCLTTYTAVERGTGTENDPLARAIHAERLPNCLAAAGVINFAIRRWWPGLVRAGIAIEFGLAAKNAAETMRHGMPQYHATFRVNL